MPTSLATSSSVWCAKNTHTQTMFWLNKRWIVVRAEAFVENVLKSPFECNDKYAFNYTNQYKVESVVKT